MELGGPSPVAAFGVAWLAFGFRSENPHLQLIGDQAHAPGVIMLIVMTCWFEVALASPILVTSVSLTRGVFNFFDASCRL